LSDPGVIEVGYRGGLRFSVMLSEQPLPVDGEPSLQLGPDSVFVVTGAAGGITSAIVADLAAASRGIFYLLDLVQLPARDDPHTTLFRQGRESLKAGLIEEARAAGTRPTPAQIDRQIAGVERAEAALRSVEAVEAAGGKAHYHSLDLRDGDAAAAVIEDVRQRYGRIDVLIHAAGLLVDRTLPDKEPSQFDLVFDVKADGFYHLLHAARGLPIATTVAFSSVAGRFGNNGQSDYSAANDLLCKLTSSLRRWRPETRAIALDWTAWGQIGMASRGSVPQIMEALGVDMLPPDAGVPTVRRELVCGGAGEVVVAGRLGAWLEERDASGGLDPAKAAAFLAARSPRLPMIGRMVATPLQGGVQVETTLDPKAQPFLYDHAPDEGTPWLPGVMATEAMAEVASLLVPGYSVAAVENVQMFGAFKFFRMEPRTLHLSAVVTPVGDGELLARAWLRSVTVPTVAELPAQVREHFVADVRLRMQPQTMAPVEFGRPEAGFLDTSTEQLYEVFFHGPAYQVLESAGVDHVEAVGILPQQMPPDLAPAANAEYAALMAPRLIESCFQVAAFWSLKRKGAMAFPLGFESVTAYRPPEAKTGDRMYAVVNTQDDGQTFDGRVVDEAGHVYIDLRGYHTVARPSQ
jgi:NAD(P)-dependent dehydrogenase (short-subunit alcohol dehydrogenase family)